MSKQSQALAKKRSGVSYAKWGYIFIAPFFITYLLWTLIPQILTLVFSFFEYYRDGLRQVGPNFLLFKGDSILDSILDEDGLFANYIKLFKPTGGEIPILKYTLNTLILWIMGAVPQLVIALLLAVFFTSYRLNIKGQPFFKAVIYMPNLIMASAFSMLFFTLFSNVGPINQLLQQYGHETFNFFSHTVSVRSLIALMNFLMWFGNTTLVLMSGIMGIDQALFEAATIDGATSFQVFRKITLPLLKPILVYTIITAMIGGIQMFDVPEILTNSLGNPDRTSMTLVMYLNSYLGNSKNYGMAGAISVVMFIVTGILSMLVFRSINQQYKSDRKGA